MIRYVPAVEFEFWQHDPVPIWGVLTTESEPLDWLADPFMNLLVANEGGITYRGVSLDRLPAILSLGIDVDPTDGIIYCEFGEKAYEYGDFPRVLMVLRYRDEERQVMFRAFRTLFPDSTPESVEEATTLYPFKMAEDAAGRPVRCRVQPETQARHNYLATYGHFIPGDPWEALVAVFVFGEEEHLAVARETVRARSALLPHRAT